MRVGVLLLPTDPWTETVDRVRRLEALGYDHVWTDDHLSWRRYRDRAWHAAIPWRPLASPAAFADFAGRFRELGVTHLVFHHPRPDDPVWTEPEEIVEKVAVEVLPGVQGSRG